MVVVMVGVVERSHPCRCDGPGDFSDQRREFSLRPPLLDPCQLVGVSCHGLACPARCRICHLLSRRVQLQHGEVVDLALVGITNLAFGLGRKHARTYSCE
jgi:hypothetical protein